MITSTSAQCHARVPGHGAGVNAVDRYGGTPALDAVRHRHADVLAFLRAHGARLPAEAIKGAAAGPAGAACRSAAPSRSEPARQGPCRLADRIAGTHCRCALWRLHESLPCAWPRLLLCRHPSHVWQAGLLALARDPGRLQMAWAGPFVPA